MERIPTREEVREWLARRISDARQRGLDTEVDYLLDRYALVDDLVTSMEIMAEVENYDSVSIGS